MQNGCDGMGETQCPHSDPNGDHVCDLVRVDQAIPTRDGRARRNDRACHTLRPVRDDTMSANPRIDLESLSGPGDGDRREIASGTCPRHDSDGGRESALGPDAYSAQAKQTGHVGCDGKSLLCPATPNVILLLTGRARPARHPRHCRCLRRPVDLG